MVTIVRIGPTAPAHRTRHLRITDAGRHELLGWLDTPSATSTGYRDDLYLELAAAARLGSETLGRVVRRERQALFGELRTLRELASAESDQLVALLLDGATLQVTARIELLDRAEQRAEDLVRPWVSDAVRRRTSPGRRAWPPLDRERRRMRPYRLSCSLTRFWRSEVSPQRRFPGASTENGLAIRTSGIVRSPVSSASAIAPASSEASG